MTSVAEVRLWGRQIGAVSVDGPGKVAAFEYTPEFRRSGIEIAPLTMPLAPGAGPRVHRFGALAHETFHGLPGLLADSLPDKFGNAILDAWLAARGRAPSEIDAVERLCYTGRRGMGALEFEPVLAPTANAAERLDLAALVDLASDILSHRSGLDSTLDVDRHPDALLEILRVGSSAGGARAKAVIAWNRTTEEVRSGQLDAPDGFEHWLLKFDGVTNNRDRELVDPLGFGRIEFAYSEMARAAGIDMSECRLLEEGGRSHFMTRRFDRPSSTGKLHMQSLGAIAHLDFNQAGAHSYEQAMLVIRRLELRMADLEELFRRMAFNVVARNQDDHVKNIAFLMDQSGAWSLAPAFDLTFAHNPDGAWTSRHQMSLNGKRDDFDRDDFRVVGRTVSLKRGRPDAILDEVLAAVAEWPEFAVRAGVSEARSHAIGAAHRVL